MWSEQPKILHSQGGEQETQAVLPLCRVWGRVEGYGGSCPVLRRDVGHILLPRGLLPRFPSQFPAFACHLPSKWALPQGAGRPGARPCPGPGPLLTQAGVHVRMPEALRGELTARVVFGGFGCLPPN